MGEKDNEFQRIKLDSRYTRVRELETELKAYYTESRRLQRVVEELESQRQEMESIGEDNDRLTQQNVKLRELVVKMKQVQDYYKEQHENLHLEFKDMKVPGSQVEQYERQIEDLQNQIETFKTKLEDTEQINLDLKQSNAELQRISDEIQFTNNGLNREISDLKICVSDLETVLEHKSKQMEKMAMDKYDQQENLRTSVVSVQQQLAEKEKECNFLNASLKEKSEMLTSKNAELLQLKEYCEKVEQDSATLSSKVKDLKKANTILLDEVSKLKETIQSQQDKIDQHERIIHMNVNDLTKAYLPRSTTPLGEETKSEDVVEPVHQECESKEQPALRESPEINTEPVVTDVSPPNEEVKAAVDEAPAAEEYTFEEVDTKSNIYDDAATNVQRLARGFLNRRKVKRLKVERAEQLKKELEIEALHHSQNFDDLHDFQDDHIEPPVSARNYDEFGASIDEHEYHDTTFEIHEEEPIIFNEDSDHEVGDSFDFDDMGRAEFSGGEEEW